MISYKFYWRDEKEKVDLIAILPERRKNPERITEKSILNWAWEIIGENSGVKDTYFERVEVQGFKK
jgi:hypothetical protein